jgi:hypothetical protein
MSPAAPTRSTALRPLAPGLGANPGLGILLSLANGFREQRRKAAA